MRGGGGWRVPSVFSAKPQSLAPQGEILRRSHRIRVGAALHRPNRCAIWAREDAGVGH